MTRRICSIALIAAMASAAAWAASPPVIVGDEGATYEDLAREKKLVTFVLKDGARASNYMVRSLHDETVSVIDEAGTITAFKFSDIREVRVQPSRIEPKKVDRKEGALTTDDRKIVDDALRRAIEIFDSSRNNQKVRMQAAMVLAASTHESRLEKQQYLRGYMTANDAPIAVEAATMIWKIGLDVEQSAIANGLVSGNRSTRAQAAMLVGLTENIGFLVDVRKLLKDPTVEIFPSAARAIARLGDRESLPIIFDGIRALDDSKGEACVFALTEYGGSDVRQRLLTMLPDARGNEWFRIVRVLYKLGDEQAARLLRDDALLQPAFQREAAILLANQGSIEAIQFLREFLTKQHDPNEINLIYRGRVGLALFQAGDIQAKGIIQDVLNTNPNEIYAKGKTSDASFKEKTVQTIQVEVLRHVGDAMDRKLLSLLGPPIQSPDPIVAVHASIAAMQVANPEFGMRVREANQ